MIRLWSSMLPRLCLFGTILWAAPGCYRYHVYQVGGPAGIEGGNQPATEWENRTRHSFFWGLIRQDVPTENCTLGDGTRTGIEEVTGRHQPGICRADGGHPWDLVANQGELEMRQAARSPRAHRPG